MRFISGLLVAICLTACATQSYTPPPVGNERAEIFMRYGAGGDALSAMLGPGQGTLGQQITQKYGSLARVASYQDWTDYSIATTSKAIIFIGDSCGASVGPFLAATLNRQVLAVIGIQASIYCPTVGTTDPVPSNVTYALETYNPNCDETAGLGCRIYTAGPHTKLTIVQRPDLHPALTQDSFNDVLSELGMILAPSSSLKAELGGSRTVVRYHGQRL